MTARSGADPAGTPSVASPRRPRRYRLAWPRSGGAGLGWRPLAVALLVVALLARAAFVFATPAYAPHVDDADYLRLGKAIAHSGAYPTPHVWVTWRGCPPLRGLPATPCVAKPGAAGAHRIARPTAYRPPGYPYALGAVELVAKGVGAGALNFARGFQVLLGVLDVALVGLLAGMVWGRRVGLIALGLAAVYLPLIEVSGTLISEPLYVALMLGATCAVLRWGARGKGWMLPLAGVLAGLGALTRSNGIILLVALPALAIALGGRRRGLRRVGSGLLVLVCAVLTILPWTIRNAVELKQFVPISTETGGTLVGTYNPTSRADRTQRANWFTLSDIGRYHVLYKEQTAHPETAIDATLRRDSINFAVAHPPYVASVVWHNTLRLFELGGFARTRMTAASVDLPGGPAVAAAIMLYPVALLALAGALLPAARRAPRVLWLLAALQFASTVLVTSETPRFRSPLEPFILLLAALSIERLGVAAAARRRAGAHVRVERQ